MKIEMIDNLPFVSASLKFNGKQKIFNYLLLDTGCSSTILDTDLAEGMDLLIDLENATTRKMYGIGGTEICIEQKISDLTIDEYRLHDFTLQLGDVNNMYGFEGIIGNDFLMLNKLVVDFNRMVVRQDNL